MATDENWDKLIMPARFEPEHPTATTTSIGWKDWRTEEGELLWPERFGETELRTLETEIGGSYNVAAQLQQRPSPEHGGIFDRANFRYFILETIGGVEYLSLLDAEGKTRRVESDRCFWFQTVDTATKEKQHNDWTVVGTFALTPPPVRLCVVDMYRARLAVPKQFGVLMAQYGRWPRVQVQAIEDKSSGTGLLQQALQQGIPMRALQPGTKDKIARSVVIATMYENGAVYHRAADQAPWLECCETEVLQFPTSDWDDQADVLSYAGMMSQGHGISSLYATQTLAGPPPESDGDTPDREGDSWAKRLTGRG
jgi:predicted phage terminase large subunit-like protein